MMKANQAAKGGLPGKHHVCDYQGRPFYIVSPADGQSVAALEAVRGVGAPGASVQLILNDGPALSCRSDRNGVWAAKLPCPAAAGGHRLSAIQRSPCCCLCDCIRVRVTPPAALEKNAPAVDKEPEKGPVAADSPAGPGENGWNKAQ